MRKLTHSQFISLISPSISILGIYSNGRSPIAAECKDCSHRWEPVARSLINGHGCPECGKKIAAQTTKWNISQDHFIQKIAPSLKGKIKILGEYKSVYDPIKVECKICNCVWDSNPQLLYQGYGCSNCGHRRTGEACRLKHEDFVRRVDEYHMKALSVLGTYDGGNKRIKTKCLQCGYVWSPIAIRLLRRGCPCCCSSRGEKKIQLLLKQLDINFKREFVFNDLYGLGGGLLRYDFAVFQDTKMCCLIEYDGSQHFKPCKRFGGEKRFLAQLANDSLKNEYAISLNVPLIRVKYSDYGKLNIDYLRGRLEHEAGYSCY